MIGADPELFLTKGNKFISSIGRIGGSKTEPRRLLGGFCLQEDNVSVEYNIPPVKTAEAFVFANMTMLDEINNIAASQGLTTSITSSARFDDDELEHPMARVFGCDPDFNAWELEPNPSPQCDDANLRSAGGHIHIGFEGKTKDKINLVRVLDLFLGVPLAFLDPESKRRELYGKAGACRFKPYGVEYRTPSNVWLKDEALMFAVARIANGATSKEWVGHWAERTNEAEDLIKRAINELDKNAYTVLLSYIRQEWPGGLLPKSSKNKIDVVLG